MSGNTRQCNFQAFLKETIAPSLAKRGAIKESPVLGVDESLNNEEHIGALERRLLINGVISLSDTLWYTPRRIRDGSIHMFAGRRPKSISDWGKAILGYSWSDEAVISNLISYFMHEDRICLLTADINEEKNGIRHILENEVAPTLNALIPQRLGLLVLGKSRNVTLQDYAQAVEVRLLKDVEAGFAWEEISH